MEKKVTISLEVAEQVTEFLGKCAWKDVQHFLARFIEESRKSLEEVPKEEPKDA